MSENPQGGASPRRVNTVALAAVVVAYAVSLWDASSWAWLALLLPVLAFAARVVVPAIPAWPALLITTAVVVALNFDLRAEGSFFLVCMGAFAVASERDRWWPERLILIVAVASPIIDALGGSDSVRGWNWPFWSMGVAVSAGFGSVLLQQRRLTASLAEAQEQLARQAAGEERRRIAREVHDLVGHSLTVVLMHLTGARRLVSRDPAEAQAALLEAERMGRESLTEIRRTVALLRDESDGLTPIPGTRDLDELVAGSVSAGMHVEYQTSGPLAEIDETSGLALYRIVQESLANAARHASGADVRVEVDVDDSAVTVRVSDSGGSRAPTRPGVGGTGLAGMRERASSLGGSLTAGPHGGGWRVLAVLPRQPRSAVATT